MTKTTRSNTSKVDLYGLLLWQEEHLYAAELEPKRQRFEAELTVVSQNVRGSLSSEHLKWMREWKKMMMKEKSRCSHDSRNSCTNG